MLTWIRDRSPWQRDALTAATTFTVGVVVYLLGLRTLIPLGVAAPDWLRLGVLLVGCAGQLFRSTRPLVAIAVCLAAIAADFTLGMSFQILLVLSDTCYVSVLYTSRRTSRIAVATICVVAAGCAVAVAAPEPTWRAGVLSALQVIGLFAIPMWWATNVRDQTTIAASERARAQQVQHIADLDRQAAVDAERSTMARDLHDVIAGHLSGIAIQSAAALSMMDSPATVRSALDTIRSDSLTALEEMRAMIGLLRSGGRAGQAPHGAPPRLTDIEALVRSARAAGTPLTVRADLAEPLPAAVDIAGYRIVQEAVTNAVKHAPGRPTTVTLRLADGALSIEVRNDLSGEPAAGTGTGLGIETMTERAGDLGGTARACRDGDHWLVAASLPLTAEVLR